MPVRCPSCGFVHAGEFEAPAPDVVILVAVNEPIDAITVIEVPMLSQCPLCPFTSDNADDFNRHMVEGKHDVALVDAAEAPTATE